VKRLNSAFRFIDLSFRLAQSHEAIQKPWMLLSLGGAALTLLWLPAMAALILFWGSRPFAWILVGLILLLYLMSLAAWGEITALQTAQIFAGLIRENTEQEAPRAEKSILQESWLAVLMYALSIPGLALLFGLQKLFKGGSDPEREWIRAQALVPPILALEGASLGEAVSRVRELVAKNLLRFQPGYLPVGSVACGMACGSILVGAVAGGLVAGRLASPNFAPTRMAWIAVCVGMGVMGIFTMGGIAFSTYFRTCYHTALYIWAQDVEAAQKGTPVSPPEILSQAMVKKAKDRKEGRDATET
jgi:hypothetical protein